MLEVRSMKRADKPAIMTILDATPEFRKDEVEVAEELIDCYLDGTSADYFLLVAEEDAKVLGYLCYGPRSMTVGTWDIYWMAVEHNQQGKGIGTALMEEVEKRIAEAKGRIMVIETSATPLYEKTRRFYIKRHWDVACQIDDFYDIGDGLVLYVKRLG